jgi:hypothetical protein
MSDRELQEYFHFDDADLEANRNGRLSEKQMRNLVKESKSWQKGGIIGGIVLLGISSIFPIGYFPQAIKSFSHGDILGGIGPIIIALIWLVIWGGLGYLMLIGSLKRSDKIFINRATGPINLVAVEHESGGEHSSTTIDYKLHVGKKAFDLDDDAGDVLVQGQVYTFYFTESPDGMPTEFLSVERA